MRKRMGIWMIVMCVITIGGVLGSYLWSKYNKNKSESDVLGTQAVVNMKFYPHITSIPDISVKIGDWFEYRVEVSDLDTEVDDIKVYLTEKPQWMYIDNGEVRGVPLEEGTYKYIVTVSDGVNSTSNINYVLVLGDEDK